MANPFPNDQFEYFRNNPPRCLTDFDTQPISLDGFQLDGHGSSGSYPDGLVEQANIGFKISCKCGGKTFVIIASSEKDNIQYSMYGNFVIAEQYILQCTACGKKSLLFNPSIHGYNAEIFRIEDERYGNNENAIGDSTNTSQNQSIDTVEFKCSNCAHNNFELIARFEYSSDLFDDADFEGREQEFFSWFTGISKCEKCSTINLFIDFECA